MNQKIKKGYPLDSEGAEGEQEMLSYKDIIDLLLKEGLVANKITLVEINGDITECLWVYSCSLLLEKTKDKINGVLHGLPVKISTNSNKEEVTIKIV